MEGHNLINELIIILGASVAAAAVFHRLRVPTIICYLVVGVVLGPGVLGLVQGVEQFQVIAEFGVAFLLFTLGLEFSLPHLIALRRVVFGLGGLQMLVCIAVFGGLIWLAAEDYSLDWTATLVAASALALSSTAIVSKELAQRNEVATTHGHLAIGILLFQDIASIAILVLIAVGGEAGGSQLLLSLGIAAAKAVAFFLAVLALGKWGLPPLFTEISKTRSEELFMLTVLVVALLSAAVAHELGLSMALGAFMAGMLLGESHFRHQIESEIRPFRDVLLGIFFVSIGLIINVDLIASYWPRILFFAFCLILFKTVLIAALCRLFGHDNALSLRTGMILSQGGEFGFALLALATKGNLIPDNVASFFLSIVVISMVATPFMISQSRNLASRLLARRHQVALAGQTGIEETLGDELRNHVILCGYGRVGQTIARFLRQEEIPCIAIDDDPVRVKRARQLGENVHYGNAHKIQLLEKMGLRSSVLLIISFDDPTAAREMIEKIRQRRDNLPILVRTRDDSHLRELQEAGATEVIPETLEASLMLVSHVMASLGLPSARVFETVEQVRRERYQMLHGFILGQRGAFGMYNYHGHLHPLFLPPEAWAVNKSLAELDLNENEIEIEIHTIRRGSETILNPAGDVRLQASDIVVLSGDAHTIEAAEARLLSGR